MSDDEDRKRDLYQRRTIKALVTLSFAWAASFLLLLPRGETCTPQKMNFFGWCADPNNVGDFLAGVFAPLALLWLAAAVFIQSKEFRAQKQELTLTRKELELTREVATEAKEATKAHAKEAARSGDYFQTQTEILAADERRKQQDEAAQELAIMRELENRPQIETLMIETRGKDQSTRRFSVTKKISVTLITRIYPELSNCESFVFVLQTEESLNKKRTELGLDQGQSKLNEIIEHETQFVRKGKELSAAKQLEWETPQREEALKALHQLRDLTENKASNYRA